MVQFSIIVIPLLFWVQEGSSRHHHPPVALEVQDLRNVSEKRIEQQNNEDLIVTQEENDPKKFSDDLILFDRDRGIDLDIDFDNHPDDITLEATSKIKIQRCKNHKCENEVEEGNGEEDEDEDEDEFDEDLYDEDDEDEDDNDGDDGDDGDDDDGDDAFDEDIYDEDDYGDEDEYEDEDEYDYEDEYTHEDEYKDYYDYEYNDNDEYNDDKKVKDENINKKRVEENTEDKVKEQEQKDVATKESTTDEINKKTEKDENNSVKDVEKYEVTEEKGIKDEKKAELEKTAKSTILANNDRHLRYKALSGAASDDQVIEFRLSLKNKTKIKSGGIGNTLYYAQPRHISGSIGYTLNTSSGSDAKVRTEYFAKESAFKDTPFQESPKDAFSAADIPFGGLQHRIIGGSNAPDTAVPYQVSFRIGELHFCGGSIISKRWILTAAHCVVNKTAGSFVAVAGTNSLKHGGVVYNTDHLVSHPRYDPDLLKNDIALVRVNTDIQFSDQIKYINLPSRNTDDGKPCVLSGWGYTETNINSNSGTTPDWLQWLQVWSVNSDECRKSLSETLGPIGRAMDGRQLCAFVTYGQGSCKGDPGGPLRENLELVGVNSFSNTCVEGQPDVFTRVYYYLDWIYSQAY